MSQHGSAYAEFLAMTHSESPRLNPMRTMPNLLTIARICLAPFLVTAILERQFALGFALVYRCRADRRARRRSGQDSEAADHVGRVP